MATFDCVIAGGGLAGGLVALALARPSADARVALVEADDRLGGNHTWSFHDSDVPAGTAAGCSRSSARRWAVTWSDSRPVRTDGRRATRASRAPHFDAVVQRPLSRGGGSRWFAGKRSSSVGARGGAHRDGAAVSRAGDPGRARPGGRAWAGGPVWVPEVPGPGGRAGRRRARGPRVRADADGRAPSSSSMGSGSSTCCRSAGGAAGRGHLLRQTARPRPRAAARAAGRLLRGARACACARVLREEAGVLPLPFSRARHRRPSGSPFVDRLPRAAGFTR